PEIRWRCATCNSRSRSASASPSTTAAMRPVPASSAPRTKSSTEPSRAAAIACHRRSRRRKGSAAGSDPSRRLRLQRRALRLPFGQLLRLVPSLVQVDDRREVFVHAPVVRAIVLLLLGDGGEQRLFGFRVVLTAQQRLAESVFDLARYRVVGSED